MKQLIRRVQKLERRLLPAPPTYFERQLMARLEAARRRAAAHSGEQPPLAVSAGEIPRLRESRSKTDLATMLIQARRRAEARRKTIAGEHGSAGDPR